MRRALIVATDAYGDTKLARLNAPATDARALAEVLQDPSVGVFEVETVVNKTCHEVEVAIARFLADGRRGDTLLLHFSGHGVKDLSGELYFATTDTDLKLLKVTGVAASMVKDAIEESRASLILCLVDCCYSGAFTKATKAAETVDLTERLGGQGRAVITASTSLQLALDGEEEPSLFTRAVVEGLRSGEADLDLDGLVSLDEFYSFVHDRVTEANPDQTPVKSFNVQGEVYLARRPGPVTTPSPLSRNLLDTLESGEVWERRGAVTRLAELLVGGHPGRALAARIELERVRSAEHRSTPDPRRPDDSESVRQDAARALAAAPLEETQAIPAIPEYVVTDDDPAEADPSPGVDRESLVGAGTKSATETETDTETDAETGAETDTDAETESDVEDPGVVEPKPLKTKWWRRRSVAVVAVAALVLAGGGVASYVVLGGGLPESELVSVVENGGATQVMAIDTADPRTRRVLQTADDVQRPSVSRDRDALFYLSGGADAKEPWRSSVDGADPERLFDDAARTTCPKASRPAESPDGEKLVFACTEGPEGDGIAVLEDGELTWVTHQSDVRGPLTWKGEDSVVYTAPADGATGLFEVAVEESADPTPIPLSEQGWASEPHWSSGGGLLYLLTPEDSANGDVYVRLDGGESRQLTCEGSDTAPTWAPDGSEFAFVRDESTLEVQSAGDECGPSTEVDVDGVPGPPSWGPR